MNSITILDSDNEVFIKDFKKVLKNVAKSRDYIIMTDDKHIGDIVVFSEKYDKQPQLNNDKGIYIVSENSTQPLIWLSQIKKPAICCGMNSSCSVSISSICDNTCVVSVLRSIITTQGKEIEPMDQPVTTDVNDKYAIMAATIVAMLLEQSAGIIL